MRIIFTQPALEDIAEIRIYVAAHYPHALASVERRLRLVLGRIMRWPESAQQVAEHPGVRMVPLVRYPYKIFYRVQWDSIEVLHIHHNAQA